MLKIYGANPHFPIIPFRLKVRLKNRSCWHWSRTIHRNVLLSYIHLYIQARCMQFFFRFVVWSTNSFPLLSNCTGNNAVLDFLSSRKVGCFDDLNRYSLATTYSLSFIFFSYHIETNMSSYFHLPRLLTHKNKSKERNYNSSNGR